ncbi:MAG: hypothetical protein Q4C30_01380 [Bacteroidia bacterium]|nr:hypothetical protein [Bacteroidia bacterium]
MAIERNIDNKGNLEVQRLMSSFAGQGVSPDFFYLTGYEGIFVEANREQVCECVISSVVSLGSDLLLVVDSSSFDAWESLCYGLGINVTLLDANRVSILDIKSILAEDSEISHIMTVGVTDRDLLLQIGLASKEYKRSFVVETIADDHIRMADLESMNVDYLLQAASDSSDMSLVIARRNKLVQTEGNARRPSQDIYAMWQNSVAFRSSSLQPMYL